MASVDEAQVATELGADALGLVGPMPSGPGIISADTAREIIAATDAEVATFLLTSRATGEAIAAHLGEIPASTVQVVREIAPRDWQVIATHRPDARRVQVIHVDDTSCIERARRIAPHVHALLLDSGRPSASVAELGGTGRTHDWSLSSSVVRAVNVPVWLAGGLTPDNVADAIESVRPYGVDLCSGVRTRDRLDRDLLARFINAVQVASDDAG